MILKSTRRWSVMLITVLLVSIFSPAQVFPVTQAHAVSSPSSSKTIYAGSIINSLEMDEQRGYIYATGTSTNELLFLNKETMEIEKRLSVGSKPTGMELVNNKLYVALSGATSIAVVDVDQKIVASTINTKIQPNRLALDGDILFYAGGNQWSEVYLKDLGSNTDTRIEQNIYQPELAVDKESHVLYVGQAGLSSNKLVAYSSTNGNKLWSLEPDHGSYASVLHVFDGHVYYGSSRINPVDRTIISTYTGQALSIDDTYVYTNQLIISKEEEIKVAASTSFSDDRQKAVIDSDRSVYSIFSYSSNIRKETFALDPSERAIEYQDREGAITFNRNLNAWALGKDEKYLYAISTEASRLLQIETASLKVVGDRYIGSKPQDVDIRNGILYVSLGGSSHIAKIDTQNESQFMAPITKLEVGELTNDIAAGIGKVYYTNNDSFAKVSVYDSVYSSYSTSYSTPKLTISPDASTLYIGETGSSGSELFSMNTATGQVTQKTADGYYSSSKEIILDENFVYYAGIRFDAFNLNHVYGEYKDQYFARILAAKGKNILSSNAFFDRDSFNPTLRLPFTASYGHIGKDDSVMIFAADGNQTAGNESYTLYKSSSYEEFKTDYENGLRPVEAYFMDTNEETQKVSGSITFQPGAMDHFVSGYRVKYYDAFDKQVTSVYEDYIYKSDRQPDGTYKREISRSLPPEVEKMAIVPVVSYEYIQSEYMENSKLLFRLWDYGTYYVDDVVLNDTDPSPSKIGGKVTFEEAAGVIAGDYYTLHFVDEEGEKLQQIGLPLAAGKLKNEFVIPNGTDIPTGAVMLSVQLVDQSGDEAPGYFLTEILDRMTLAPREDQITVTYATGAANSVTVTGLQVGDVVKVYNFYGELYKENTVANGSSSVVVGNLNLDNLYRLLYVSVTSVGKSESFLVLKGYSSSGGGGTIPGNGGGGTTPGGGGGITPGGGGTVPGGVVLPNPSEDAGNGYAQVVVTKNANGKNLGFVNIDDSLLDAEIKKPESKLEEVKLKVKEKVDEVQVTLTGSQFQKVAKKNENAVFYIESVDTGFIIPASIFKSHSIGELDRIKVKIVDSASFLVNNPLSLKGAKAVTPQYDFTILIERANGAVEEINNTNVYLKHIISFDLNDHAIESLAAITINSITGAITPVPATFTKEGNRVIATIYRKGNSVYAVVSKQISFKDVPSSHYAKAAIDTMSSRMVVQGYVGGAFQPDAFVTRAEFAVMLIKTLGIVPTAEETKLSDVKNGAWYYDSVSSAVKAGLLNGYENGTFRPNQTITQQEMLFVLNNALSYGGYNDKSSGSTQKFDAAQGYDEWSEQAVNVLLNEGIINKKEVFEINADKKTTRAESIELLYRMIKKLNMV